MFDRFYAKIINDEKLRNILRDNATTDESEALTRCVFSGFLTIEIISMIALGVYLHTFLVIVPIVLTFFGSIYNTTLMYCYMRWKEMNNIK